MPNTNLENSKINMKTRIRNRVQAGQTPRDLGRLAKSARFVGLLDDAEVETDIDTQMSAAIPTASVDDLVEMSEGIAELRGSSADMGQVATTDNLTEGGNKFLKAANVQSEISVAGDLSYDNGVVSYTAPTAAALQVVATVGDLPLDAAAGTQAVVTANNKLYIKTAEGWYAVALINTAPTVSGNDAAYTLATDQTPTVITMTATDPENDPVSFSHSVTAGSLNGTTVEQNDNVFTITPHASNPTTFELTFSASDTVNVATSSASSFTLAFSTDWSAFSGWNTTHIVNPNPGYSTWTSASDGHKFGTTVAMSENYFVVGSQDWFAPGYRGGRHYLYDMSGTLLHTLDFGAANYYTSNTGSITNGKRKCLIHEGKGIVVVTSNRKNGGNNQTVLDIYSISTGNLLTSWFGLNPGSEGRQGDDLSITEDGNTLIWSSYGMDWAGATSGGAYTIDLTDPSNPVLGSLISGGGKFSARTTAINNNWLLYGADGTDVGSYSEQGRAYLYNLSTQSTYQIEAPIGENMGNFGMGVGLNDTYLVISAPGRDGTVWIFNFDSTDDNASAPTIKGKISGGNSFSGYSNNFGQGIEVTDSAFFISSHSDDQRIWAFSFDALPTGGTANSDLSAAYLSTLTISNPNTDGGSTNDKFASEGSGASRHNFAVSGTKIVAGAPGAQESGYNASGTAYLFEATT